MKKHNNRGGAALIYLLGVFVIVGVIAAITSPAWATYDEIDEPYCEIQQEWVPCPTTTTVVETTTTEAPTTTLAPTTTTTIDTPHCDFVGREAPQVECGPSAPLKVYTSPPPEVPAAPIVTTPASPELAHTGLNAGSTITLVILATLAVLLGLLLIARGRREDWRS